MNKPGIIIIRSKRPPCFRHAWVLLLVCVVLLPVRSRSQTFQFLRFVAVSHNVGHLQWSSYPNAQSYSLYRHYPAQQGFSLVASVADTQYLDTLHRVVCADTVSYYVEAVTPYGIYQSDVVGIYYFDDVPTAPCSLRICTVDTVSDRVLLTWYPTPDTDAIGYYLCIGSPCVDYDTVWGRLNTSYLCPHGLSTDSQYRFRVLAFDSCFQASPLTPYYYNPTLFFPDSGCTRHFSCSWNRYINMPDSVGRYRLHYRLGDQEQVHIHETGPDGPFQFDTVIDDLSIQSVKVYLTVDNTTDSLHAFSQLRTRYFAIGDTADYLRIAGAEYDENIPSVTLTIDIDPDYDFPQCFIYRSQGSEDRFEPIATLDRGNPSAPLLHYVDRSINRAAGRYVYRVGIPDFCQQWMKYSDTVQLLLPDVSKPMAFFPNAIIYGHPECGTFCPTYLSPLSVGYQLDIFTRWGQLVFHTNTLDHCWNGTSPSGQPLSQGTYVYRALVSHADGTVRSYHGTVLLLR